MIKHTLSAIALALALPATVWADGLQKLEDFMRTAQAGRAQFTQTVTAPVKAGESPRSKTSSGEFSFQRPGQFKFVYAKPFEQTIVADGKTLWLYDVDLNQVTQRQQAQVLGSTPAAILAASHDLNGLKKDFVLAAAPEADGMEWVEAKPKAADGQLKSVRVGFVAGQLAAMDILDGFGQRSVIRFTGLELLPRMPAGTFQFAVPAGADVLVQ